MVAVGKVLERGGGEKPLRVILHLFPDLTNSASRRQLAGARAWQALHRCDAAVEDADDVAHGDLSRGSGEHMAALGTALTLEQPCPTQCDQKLVEEVFRDHLASGNVAAGDGSC